VEHTEWIARNALVRIVERYEHRPEVHRPDGCKIAAKALADIFEEDLFEVSLVEAKRVFCLMAQVPVNQFGECTMIVDPATGEQSYSRSLPAPEW